MGLVRSSNEISRRERHFSRGYVLGDAEMVRVTFRTRAEVVKRVLPPPLEPDPKSTGFAYVAEFHRTNFGATYNEAGLFLLARYKGEEGQYCLSMPVTDDMAMVAGREVYGFPKKMAETIGIKREGNEVTGVCIRRGIPIIKIKVNLTGPVKLKANAPTTPNYLFKYLPNSDPKSGNFDHNPRLIKLPSEIDRGQVESGEGELTLTKSEYDPIYNIPVEEVIAAIYAQGMEVRLQSGEVIAAVDPKKFLPYSFIKSDWELI